MGTFRVQVLIQVHYAGINGGCETFRARREFAFASSNRCEGLLLWGKLQSLALLGQGVGDKPEKKRSMQCGSVARPPPGHAPHAQFRCPLHFQGYVLADPEIALP